MELNEYFQTKKGTGILATADKAGVVDAAIYARLHTMQDGTVAAIMRDRLSHENLQSNPHAVFMFIEDGPGYTGKRFYLTKVGEDDNPEAISALSRRKPTAEGDEKRFLVYFRIDRTRALVGD